MRTDFTALVHPFRGHVRADRELPGVLRAGGANSATGSVVVPVRPADVLQPRHESGGGWRAGAVTRPGRGADAGARLRTRARGLALPGGALWVAGLLLRAANQETGRIDTPSGIEDPSPALYVIGGFLAKLSGFAFTLPGRRRRRECDAQIEAARRSTGRTWPRARSPVDPPPRGLDLRVAFQHRRRPGSVKVEPGRLGQEAADRVQARDGSSIQDGVSIRQVSSVRCP